MLGCGCGCGSGSGSGSGWPLWSCSATLVLVFAFVCRADPVGQRRTLQADEVYLNLVLEYFPETLYQIERHHSKAKNIISTVQTKLYTYQLLRALAYIHAKGVCHRDIKPQNLLLNTEKHILKLCDFGSAKKLVKGEPNIAYICSRYYRAPELIFGATDYTPAIGEPQPLRCCAPTAPLALNRVRPGSLCRCVVDGVCDGRTAARAAALPRAELRRPTGGDYQGPGHAVQGRALRYEPQLHRVQVPAGEAVPVGQGLPLQDP